MAEKRRRRKNPDGRMSLGAHLIELRNRLFIAAIAVAAAMAAGWYLTPWVWSMLRTHSLAVRCALL